MEALIIAKQAYIVQVSTAIGCFSGLWCSAEPVVSRKYIVELDSDEVLTSDAVEHADSNKPSIEHVDQVINIIGYVEEIQDNVMVLRLQTSLMMLEVSSELDFRQYIGHYVRVRLCEIKLYDTGIY